MKREPERARLEPSAELRAITERYWAAFTRGDVEAVVARFSLMPGTTMFGTDESEFIDDPDRLVHYTRLEFEGLGGWPLGPAEVDAWVEGQMGWSIVRSSVELPPASHRLRVTLLFHLEHDDWKIVHEHWSVGRPNEEVFGLPHVFNLDVVAEVVEQEQPDLKAWTSADGTLTLVFTDIAGSTALNLSFGDRAWLKVLRAHNEIVARVTAEHGGTVVKGQGDGFMLAFASVRRALACALEIEREIGATFDDPGSPIRVRIGVHTGEVVNEADDFFGHAVNYAARITGAATGGEILVSNLVHDLIEPTGEFRFDPPREVELKGIDDAARVHPLSSAE